MKSMLSFARFSLLEARATTHFRDRLAERTYPDNIDLGLPSNFLANFSNPDVVVQRIKEKIKQLAEENTYAVMAKGYKMQEACTVLVLDPKVEFQGKIYNCNLKITSTDDRGQLRTYQGPFWIAVQNDVMSTFLNSVDLGDEALIAKQMDHVKRKDKAMFDTIEKFFVDRTTAPHQKVIKVLPDGTIVDELSKQGLLHQKEFQTVIKPGLELSYYGFGPDKTLVPKTATVESIVKLNGQPIDFKVDNDAAAGVKVFFTNKASKSFVPNKDVILIDGQKAEITKIFMDKRMANPINFMLRVKLTND